MNNFAVRTISAAVFTVIMVASLLFSPLVYGALFLVIMSVAMQELFTMVMEGRYLVQQKLTLLAGAAFFIISICVNIYGLDPRWHAVALLILALIPVSVLFRKDHTDFGVISICYTALLYICLPLTLSQRLVFSADGAFDGKLLLSIFVIVWLCDVGAFCVGSALGQRPGARRLAPTISPKKSWWGFWGGVVLGSISAVVLKFVGWIPFPLVHAIALGALVSVAGICGDLVESLWKRYAGVKDSGNVIPGHGGMLDRFDSSLLAIPVAYVYMILAGLL